MTGFHHSERPAQRGYIGARTSQNLDVHDNGVAGPLAAFGNYGLFGFLLLVLAALVGLPLVFIVVSTVLVDPFNFQAGVSIGTLRSVFGSPSTWQAAWQTFLMSAVVSTLATALGGVLAWTLTRFRIPYAATLETLVVLPLFLSPLVGAMAWIALAAPRSGILNNILDVVSAPSWLHVNVTSIGGIAFVMTLHYVPYGYLFLSSALRNFDASLEDASYLCGAGLSGTALKVLIPLVRAAVLSSILFIAILAAGEFAVPSILGARTSYTPLSVLIYEAVYGFPQDYPRAATLGTLLVGFSLCALYFYRRNIAQSRQLITVTGRGFNARRMAPGRMRGPILGLLGLYLALSVAFPYLALIFICLTRFRTGDLSTTELTFANIRQVMSHPAVGSALRNTLAIGAIVPLLCISFGVILAYGQERLKTRLSSLAAYVATAPIAISGIVFGTGVFVVFLRTPVYGTIWVIVFALFAHYLAHALRIAGNGISQIDPSLEEAARVNGASQSKVLTSIMVPLLRPSLFSAFVLIYVFAVREVNTAILLYTPSSSILSVLSWNYLSDGSLSQAAVVGLIQTGLMLGGMIFVRLVFGVSATRSAM